MPAASKPTATVTSSRVGEYEMLNWLVPPSTVTYWGMLSSRVQGSICPTCIPFGKAVKG